MKFIIEGTMLKTLWTGPQSKLVLIKEIHQQKEFAVFVKEDLSDNSNYKIEGEVGKSVSKKYKNEKGQWATEYSFNADNVTILDAPIGKGNLKDKFVDHANGAYSDDIPF